MAVRGREQHPVLYPRGSVLAPEYGPDRVLEATGEEVGLPHGVAVPRREARVQADRLVHVTCATLGLAEVPGPASEPHLEISGARVQRERAIELRPDPVRQGGVDSSAFEAAIGQAAWGGICAGPASATGAVSSAMASTCM